MPARWGEPGRGSDSPLDCHSLPRLRFAYPLHKGDLGAPTPEGFLTRSKGRLLLPFYFLDYAISTIGVNPIRIFAVQESLRRLTCEFFVNIVNKLHAWVQLLIGFSLLVEGHMFLLLEKEKKGMYYKRSKGKLLVRGNIFAYKRKIICSVGLFCRGCQMVAGWDWKASAWEIHCRWLSIGQIK